MCRFSIYVISGSGGADPELYTRCLVEAIDEFVDFHPNYNFEIHLVNKESKNFFAAKDAVRLCIGKAQSHISAPSLKGNARLPKERVSAGRAKHNKGKDRAQAGGGGQNYLVSSLDSKRPGKKPDFETWDHKTTVYRRTFSWDNDKALSDSNKTSIQKGKDLVKEQEQTDITKKLDTLSIDKGKQKGNIKIYEDDDGEGDQCQKGYDDSAESTNMEEGVSMLFFILEIYIFSLKKRRLRLYYLQIVKWHQAN